MAGLRVLRESSRHGDPHIRDAGFVPLPPYASLPHEQVSRHRGRIEVTRDGSSEVCVLISKAELEALERCWRSWRQRRTSARCARKLPISPRQPARHLKWFSVLQRLTVGLPPPAHCAPTHRQRSPGRRGRASCRFQRGQDLLHAMLRIRWLLIAQRTKQVGHRGAD